MSNYTYNKDNLKYLHHSAPISKKEQKEKKKFKKELEGKVKENKMDPRYHDCKYKGTPNAYKACSLCLYRFTCKYIRYNITPEEAK